MLSYMRQGKDFYLGMARLATPIILQNLITSSLGMVDTFMVGQLPGEAPMAAVTLANIPIFVILLLIFGLQSGASVLISQYWGKQDRVSINRILGIGLYIGSGISTLFALVGFFFPLQFMGLFSNNEELVAIAASYLQIVGFSYIFNSITQVYLGAHRSMENPKLGLCVLSVSMCTNTFLNWVFIFGNLGAPELGVRGAALATLLARTLEFLVAATYACFNRHFRIQFRPLLCPGRAMLATYVRYSTLVVFNETVWGVGTALYPTIMGHMAGSTEILAAYTIAGNIEKIATVAVFAVAATAAIIVGREIGSGHTDTIYEKGLAIHGVSLIVGTVVAIITALSTLFIIDPYIYGLFTLSDRAQDIASMMLLASAIMLPIRGLNCASVVGILRGGGDVRASTAIDTMPLWCVSLPLAFLFGSVLKWSILWVYLAIMTENMVKFFFGVARFRSRNWIHDVTKISYTKPSVTPVSTVDKIK